MNGLVVVAAGRQHAAQFEMNRGILRSQGSQLAQNRLGIGQAVAPQVQIGQAGKSVRRLRVDG